MATEPTKTMTPWSQGRLADGVTAFAPCGISQQLIMYLISEARERGATAVPALEQLEATVSITDDAIFHMMRKR